ncbi:hypothetical protein VTL71DRAFT_8713 [Oculimacula yallundae]|uniref:AAA+ ATPase domain-containing protein n=1 Tax=Oculimacula yallundae TaxID=86028 RepID=A0ABR4CZX7_9HELO
MKRLDQKPVLQAAVFLVHKFQGFLICRDLRSVIGSPKAYANFVARRAPLDYKACFHDLYLRGSEVGGFNIGRSPSTHSVWDPNYQNQRIEVFGPGDVGIWYRSKCICPEGDLHSLDVYCPRNISSEKTVTEGIERDSRDYNRKKSKKTSSPKRNTTKKPKEDSEEGTSWAAIEARKRAEEKLQLLRTKEKKMASIMERVGWKSAKDHIQKLDAKVTTSSRQGIDRKAEGFGTILMGATGTGKTTFAKEYAAYLHTTGLLGSNIVKTTTGVYLVDGGIARIKGYIEALQYRGGVLFIDDAHFLLSSKHSGTKVLDYLFQTIPLYQSNVTVILAGTEKGMRELIGHGSRGIEGMFPYLLSFADFCDEELVSIFRGVVLKKWEGKMVVEGGNDGLFVKIAAKRLGKARGMERFGNARAVEALVGQVWERQGVRREAERKRMAELVNEVEEELYGVDIAIDLLVRAERKALEDVEMKEGESTDCPGSDADDNDESIDPADYTFIKEDILGPDHSSSVLHSPARIQLQKLTGLEEVKRSVLSLLELVKANYQRELEEKPLLKRSSMDRYLSDIGLLSKGDVIVRNPSDLIGRYIGESEANTKAALNSAIGNVLVIDEAYMIYSGGHDGTGNTSDSYRQGITDTLVSEIKSEPGEDRCILLLGYDSEMEEMLQNSNPGLSRRFPLTDAFRFRNFTVEELESILRSKLVDHMLEATEDTIHVAIDILSKASQRTNFGNGGEVDTLISTAKTNYHSRISYLPVLERPKEWVFLPQDFDPNHDRGKSATANLKRLFSDVVGCDAVIKKLATYQKVALAMKSRNLNPRSYIPTNFIFKGLPGTGKTTTARKLAHVYYDMGLLSEAVVVECSASDLIGKYTGHSGPKTAKVLEKALGRVLFIDEAYRLADGGRNSFSSEVVSELVDLMTKPKYAGNLVIVLAGYEDEMNELLGMTPGLASRFPGEICFGNLSPEACVEILWMKIRVADITVAEDCFEEGGCNEQILYVVDQLVKTKGWGNARDVETLAKGVCREVFARLGYGGDLICTREVAIDVLTVMLIERWKRGGELAVQRFAGGSDDWRTNGEFQNVVDWRNGHSTLNKERPMDGQAE